MIRKKCAPNQLNRITARYRFYAAHQEFKEIRPTQPLNVPEMGELTSKKLCEDDIYYLIIFQA